MTARATLKCAAAALSLTLLTVPAAVSLGGPEVRPPIEQSSPRPPPSTSAVAAKAEKPEAQAPTYAQREAAAKDLERFQGGGAGIYIGGSTLGIVLLIVLLVVIF